MKKLISLLGLAVVFTACQKEMPGDPYATMDHHTGCKETSLKGGEGQGSSDDCIEYFWDSNLLTIKHKNAAFNCCPGRLTVSAGLKGDTLLLREHEEEALCDCDCLYDLEYTVYHIPSTVKVISIEEPYLRGEGIPLVFTVNLKRHPEGEFCLVRSKYPWGS